MRRLVVVLGLLVAACSGGTAETTTTAVAPVTTAVPASTTSTTVAPTTTSTTEPPRGIELTPRPFGAARRLAAGQLYVFNPFEGLATVDVMFETNGWEADFVREQWLGWVNLESDPPIGGSLTFFPFESFEELVARVTSASTVGEFTEPVPASLGGAEGVVLDVQVLPGPQGGCGRGPVLLDDVGSDGRVAQNLLVGCSWNRVWIVEVDDMRVVLFLGVVTQDPNNVATLNEAEDLIDEFLAAITFNP